MQADQGTQGDQQIDNITLRVESKIFFLDLKENVRGKYVKISERGSNKERSTIVVPSAGVIWFEALLGYFIEGSLKEDEGGVAVVAKQLQVESKAFFFEAGENPRGKFLRISESGPGTRGRSSLIVPAGGGPYTAWANLRAALSRMNSLYIRSQDSEVASLPRQLDEAHASSSIYSDLDASQLQVAGPQQLVGPGPSAPSIGETKAGGRVLRAGHKRFFFDLGSNQKGDFLRITEAVGNERMSIIIPGAALEQFSVAVQDCLAQHPSGAGVGQR